MNGFFIFLIFFNTINILLVDILGLIYLYKLKTSSDLLFDFKDGDLDGLLACYNK